MIQSRQFPRKPRHFSDLFEEYGAGSIARLPVHQNGGFEVHYIAKGHLHWEIEGRPFLLPPRSVFFTFPWEKHGSRSDFEPGHLFHFVVFRLATTGEKLAERVQLIPDFGLSQAEQKDIFQKLASAHRRCLAATSDFAWMMPRLTRELTQPGIMARTAIIALSRLVLGELVRLVHHSQTLSQNDSVSKQRVLQFVEELRTTCADPWTLEKMAAACRLKRTQFETLTKDLTGDAPSFLLNRFRVQQAQRSLKDSDKSVTDIAFDAGFGSSQYFSRVFRGIVGMTPSEYRHQRGNLERYDQHFLKALARLKN